MWTDNHNILEGEKFADVRYDTAGQSRHPSKVSDTMVALEREPASHKHGIGLKVGKALKNLEFFEILKNTFVLSVLTRAQAWSRQIFVIAATFLGTQGLFAMFVEGECDVYCVKWCRSVLEKQSLLSIKNRRNLLAFYENLLKLENVILKKRTKRQTAPEPLERKAHSKLISQNNSLSVTQINPCTRFSEQLVRTCSLRKQITDINVVAHPLGSSSYPYC